jgi:heme A synthase
MRPSRTLANLVGFMLFVQVILGGGAALLPNFTVDYHLYWGVATLVVLIVATVYAARELGIRSTLFRTGIAAIADFIVQAGLGLTALFTGNNAVVLVHLTNAFVLSVLVTYLISFADAADKASLLRAPAPMPKSL